MLPRARAENFHNLGRQTCADSLELARIGGIGDGKFTVANDIARYCAPESARGTGSLSLGTDLPLRYEYSLKGPVAYCARLAI